MTNANRLPRLAKVTAGCALLCIGDSRRLDWFRRHCAVITVRPDLDFYTVFSTVQQAFLRISKWVLDLYQILESEGSIQSMLEVSSAVTPASAIVVDSSFTCVASTGVGANQEGTPSGTSTGIADGVSKRIPI